jgi:hypothetical protein
MRPGPMKIGPMKIGSLKTGAHDNVVFERSPSWP